MEKPDKKPLGWMLGLMSAWMLGEKTTFQFVAFFLQRCQGLEAHSKTDLLILVEMSLIS